MMAARTVFIRSPDCVWSAGFSIRPAGSPPVGQAGPCFPGFAAWRDGTEGELCVSRHRPGTE